MPDREQNVEEENLERLLHAAYSSQVRPDPLKRAANLRRLAEAIRPQNAPSEFPEKALALLTLLLVGVGFWVLFQVASGSFMANQDEALEVMALFVLANLLLTPVAGFLIVARRRKHAQD